MATIIKPRLLKKNATLGIIAPASPVVAEKLERGTRYLEKLGFRVEIGKAVEKTNGFLAGKDEDRVADLHEMFARPDIDAIICARGGYGTPRILASIDYALIRRNPKIFVGYSDLTALQLAIFTMTGLVTFSGPMVAVEFAKGILEKTEESFWRVLSTAEPVGRLSPLAQANYRALNRGEARGRLLGGCLSLINSIVGTPYLPDFTGQILFLEDIGEEPFRVDRYLSQLANAGILARVEGVLAGQFVDCTNPDDKPSQTLDEVLIDYLQGLQIPILMNVDYGHIDLKHTIPLGVEATINADNHEIAITESAVIE